ncbi:hypothetical protein [Bradyrhizobium brasilense]|uniref:hypothetical protein n=1 Tax=Bradyrhizobium brasilense TaxID=1419277 RepID=UPI001E352617|nr:hypothetical protein [Bradyrhizobium brasilense]MCC8970046.1 hypothetical protein [Bradyrhizobium brasilense]
MALALSASTVKSWFQYRCERKVRYELFTDEELATLPIAVDVREQSWAMLGVDYEERVLRRLNEEVGVLRPLAGEFGLGEADAISFLRGHSRQQFASQLNLRPRSSLRILEGTGVSLKRVFPDLIHREIDVGGRTIFTVIDVKATRRATSFHKTQIAFYVRVLEALLQEIGVSAKVSPTGYVWRIPDRGTADGNEYYREEFGLAPYVRLVDDFCANLLPQIARRIVEPGENAPRRDETFFHLYFKCEQCKFLEHCMAAVSEARPPASRDVSAVAGITHEAKRSLYRLGVRQVGDLAKATGLANVPGIGWSLSRRADLLTTRAQAIIAQQPRRTEEAHTYLMPPRADVMLLLSVDHDPVDDRLAAIGYAHYRFGTLVREVVRVPLTGSNEEEAATIEAVLGQLVSDLVEIDASNQAGAEIHAHIFLYEPSEAVRLQEAVARHLEDPRIRGGLLHLVRLFPPEDVVPEPEFRGAHHLPATAVRTVIEQLYALPTLVSYDLRQVSHALAAVGEIADPYRPEEAFQRPFSSLLSIEVIRGLREGRRNAPGKERVIRDVSARLRTLQHLIAWLFTQNAVSSQPLLRLAKRPFRLHATFDPLNAEDLDLLLACEILESRAGLLEALIELAQPARRRRDSGRAMTGLHIVRHWTERGRRQFIFRVPPENRETDLEPCAFNLILTDDDPDLRLDPTAWPAIACRFEPPRAGFEDRIDQIRISMTEADFLGTTFRTMFDRSLTESVWCLDQAFGDINGPRTAQFLVDLAQARTGT